MTTALTLIKDSLGLIGVIGEAQDPTAEQAQTALRVLNGMLESWSLNGSIVYEESKDTHTLAAGTGSYTIGSGATINTTRPIRLVSAFVRDGSNTDFGLELIGQKTYAEISRKADQTPYPSHLYFDGNYPNATIYLWPVPASAYTLHLYSFKPISAIATINTTLAFPPGYEDAIRYNLPKRLIPFFGGTLSQELRELASETKEAIDNANEYNDDVVAVMDSALMSAEPYDIYSDT